MEPDNSDNYFNHLAIISLLGRKNFKIFYFKKKLTEHHMFIPWACIIFACIPLHLIRQGNLQARYVFL